MTELHNLIAVLEAKAAELRQHLGKDVTAAEAGILKAKAAVEKEISALLAQLAG